MDIYKKDNYEPNVKLFLITLRTQVLKLTIDEFVTQMNWGNEKYYNQIVNGYICKSEKKFKNPTVKHLFSGINYALSNYDNWKLHIEEIDILIYKYIYKKV